MKKKGVICFIPARSGSTRVKNKNIRLINGRPLIYWSVTAALRSKQFSKIIFSTDTYNYYKILVKYLKKDNFSYKNLIFDKRLNKHSRTKSKIFDYIKYDLIKKFDLGKQDLLVQMLPTCPLRSIKTIKAAINFSIFNNKNCFSASEYDFHLIFGFSLLHDNNKWKPVFKKSPMLTGHTQSQSQKIHYHPNGVINCLHVRTLNKKTKSIYQNAAPIIVPKREAFDIDSEEDLKIIKKLFK